MAGGQEAWESIKAEIARGHGVVGRRRLLEIGVHPSTIRNRLRSGRLVPVFAGAYRLEGAVLNELGRLNAAAIQCGPAAVVSHRSALSLHGVLKDRGPVDVLRTSGCRGRSRTSTDGWKVQLRRTVWLPGTDRTEVEGIPAVVVERAVVDAAPELSEDEIGSALAQGERLRIIDFDRLSFRVHRAHGRPGVSKVDKVLRDWSTELENTSSSLEERAIATIAEGSVPMPASNVPIGGWVVDLLWVEQRLIVELDGYRHHSDRASFGRDREKDRDLQARGFRVLRFTWHDVVERPEQFVDSIRQMLRIGT